MKIYTNYRCPSCGETGFTAIQSPCSPEKEDWMPLCKWVRCDTCQEIIVIPKDCICKE